MEILTETLTVTTGQTVTFKAKVTDNDELINGQLAFKLNNHSLKDNDGKLISVDVIDGIATLEYVIDDTFNVGSYTLTAVFENQLYERSVGVETFIIE